MVAQLGQQVGRRWQQALRADAVDDPAWLYDGAARAARAQDLLDLRVAH